jgi:CRISPR-associated exonuclease Cas4
MNSPSINFYASWVFKCPRWVYFKLKYPEREIVNPEIKRLGDMGEKIAREMLKKEYQVFPGKKRSLYFDGFKITGKPDFKVLLNECFEIVEVKKVRKIRKFPRKQWIAQLNLYLKMEDIESGFILEISDEKVRKGIWRFSEDLYRRSIEYYRTIYADLRDGIIPRPDRRECFFCSFRVFCSGIQLRR